MITEIKRFNLADKAYDKIKADIFSGRMKEGDKLPSENQLTRYLGVSRVVVRDALERLRKEHYIITYHGKGSFVANPSNYSNEENKAPDISYNEFYDVMEFRTAIEEAMIKRCIADATDEELAEILVLALKMEDCIGDMVAFTSLDYLFHLQIAKASHNAVFVSAMEYQKNKVYLCLELMNRLNDSRRWGAQIHNKLAECIVKRDRKGAFEILKRNEEYNIARMAEIFKEPKKK